MLASRDYERLLEAIFVLQQPVDFRDFPRHAIAATRKLIANDVCGYAEVDTLRPHAATVSDNDAWISPAAVDRWAQETTGPEILPYWQQFAPFQVIKFSDFVSVDELRSKQIYQEFYREVDVLYQMVLPFICDRKVVLSMGFSRSGSVGRDFNEQERELLIRLGPHLAQAYVAAETYERAKRGRAFSDIDLSRTETGLILLTPHGNVSSATHNARRWAAEFFGDFPPFSSRLPAPLCDWIRYTTGQRDAARRGASLPVRSPLSKRLGDRQLQVTLIDGLDNQGPALVFEHHEPIPLHEIGEILTTSARETEVIRWLLQGKTNEEIAEILEPPKNAAKVSPRTVQKHLQRIYRKLDVSSRTQAIAKIRALLSCR